MEDGLTSQKDKGSTFFDVGFIEWRVASLATQTDEKHINGPIYHFKIIAL